MPTGQKNGKEASGQPAIREQNFHPVRGRASKEAEEFVTVAQWISEQLGGTRGIAKESECNDENEVVISTIKNLI